MLWLLAVWFVVFPLVVWVARRPVPPTRAALVQPVRWFVGGRLLRVWVPVSCCECVCRVCVGVPRQ